MRRPQPVGTAVLDACVLAPPSLCDLLLRLAETPALYRPCWSAEIMAEVGRTQMLKLPRRYSEAQAAHWRREVTAAFPEAMAEVDPKIVGRLGNDPKDRHVLAAAIASGARVIVTANLRDFAPAALAPWGVKAEHPDDFLLRHLGRQPDIVHRKLEEMADGDPVEVPLRYLAAHVPAFAAKVRTMG